MRMERKNSLRDSAVGSPDHYNLKNSKHSGCWSPFMDWLSWYGGRSAIFFGTVITWVSRKKRKEKSWSLTSDALSEEILYNNILLFWCWKLSSTSHFIVFTSNTLPPAKKSHKFEWLSQIWSSLPLKNNSPSNSDMKPYPEWGIKNIYRC